jgi:hypothetical protein
MGVTEALKAFAQLCRAVAAVFEKLPVIAQWLTFRHQTQIEDAIYDLENRAHPDRARISFLRVRLQNTKSFHEALLTRNDPVQSPPAGGDSGRDLHTPGR